MAWDEIFGHEFAKRVLQAHLASGEIPSAYLLAGPDGVGKRRLALEFAKATNCASDGVRPCETCAPCTQINRRTHPDVHAIIPSGASDRIRIEDVRRLIGRVNLRPFSARMQVAILDGAERLTEEAANSLLKVLEEPPAHARFVLTTAHVSRCLPTVRSRCHLIRCQPLPREVVQRILSDTQRCDPQVAEAIARLSWGSASHAIDLAGRWAAYQQGLTRLSSDAPSAWLAHPLPETREELVRMLDGMMAWLRDLVVAAAANPKWVAHAMHAKTLTRQAQCLDLDRGLAVAFELVELRESIEQFVSVRLVGALAREKWLSLYGENE